MKFVEFKRKTPAHILKKIKVSFILKKSGGGRRKRKKFIPEWTNKPNNDVIVAEKQE